MNQYPAWKNLLVIAVLAIGAFVALPNLFGKAPSVQISREDSGDLLDTTVQQVESVLDQAGIEVEESYLEEGRLMVRFADVEPQLRASELLRDNLGKNYVVALTLAPRTPVWLRAAGLEPMSLGARPSRRRALPV